MRILVGPPPLPPGALEAAEHAAMPLPQGKPVAVADRNVIACLGRFREMRGHGKAASAEGDCHAGRPVVKLTGSPIPRSGHLRERKKLPPLTEITVLNAALSGEAPD